MEIVLIVVVAIVGIIIYSGVLQAKALEAAKQSYLQSLAELKKAPTNADLKQRTLALGRAYSHLTREKKGSTVFDEVALMNDINAACAAAASWRPETPTVSASSGESIEARLRTLTALREKGLIEATEYEKRRAEILGSI